VTPVVETSLGYFIAKVEEIKPPETKPLDAVKKEIADQLYRREKAADVAKAEADKALNEVKKGKKLAELYPKPAEEAPGGQFATSNKPVATDSGEFNAAAASIPQMGMAPEVVKTVFALDAPATLDRLFEVNGDYFVVVVNERHKPTDEEYINQKSQLTTEAIKGKQFELREAFVKSLRKSAAVVQNTPAIDKVTGADGA
jgi:peptidyl-prolyl cis-trans isomerase D